MGNHTVDGFAKIKLVLIIAGSVVLLAGVAVVLWLTVFASVWNQSALPDNQDQQAPRIAVIDEEITNKVQAAELAGDTAGAIAVYDQAIQQESDSQTKAELQLRKSVIYSNTDNLQEAIQTAEAAATTDPGALGPVTLLAVLYEQVKEYKKAAEQYRKAAELTQGTEETDATRDYYLENAARLEAM